MHDKLIEDKETVIKKAKSTNKFFEIFKNYFIDVQADAADLSRWEKWFSIAIASRVLQILV